MGKADMTVNEPGRIDLRRQQQLGRLLPAWK
jgi:hypothetical protein